jgi:lactate dehydrogenase-like 2-hydroxyacid dehydrogenase
LQVNISGSGDVRLKGAANRAHFSISGSGDIHAFEYLVEDLTCRIAGAGDIEAHVADRLDAQVAGAGDIHYRGRPASVRRKVSGAGTIKSID